MEESRDRVEWTDYISSFCDFKKNKFKEISYISKLHSERSTSADQFSTGCLHWPHRILFFLRINAEQIQGKETLCKKYLQTSIWIKPQSTLDGIWFTSSFIQAIFII